MYAPVAVTEPELVVTITLTRPRACAGAVTVIEFSELTMMPVAALPPKVTPVAVERFVPVMVTALPPPMGPKFGLNPEIVAGLT